VLWVIPFLAHFNISYTKKIISRLLDKFSADIAKSRPWLSSRIQKVDSGIPATCACET